MYYASLATDYDGNIAHHGNVDEPTISAIQRQKNASRCFILVTSRELDDLIRAMPRIGLFDLVIDENGAELYRPMTKQKRTLAAPSPPEFAARLRELGVSPLSVGRVSVAGWNRTRASCSPPPASLASSCKSSSTTGGDGAFRRHQQEKRAARRA